MVLSPFYWHQNHDNYDLPSLKIFCILISTSATIAEDKEMIDDDGIVICTEKCC